MCTAVTFRSDKGTHVNCAQSRESGPLGLCYFHQKMYDGHIEPSNPDYTVQTSFGVKIYPSPNRRK